MTREIGPLTPFPPRSSAEYLRKWDFFQEADLDRLAQNPASHPKLVLEWHLCCERLHWEALVKAALAHVQSETIHPFLDGNGRVGRLLITLLLCLEGALQQPLLYLSLFFKRHRSLYYDLLQTVAKMATGKHG